MIKKNKDEKYLRALADYQNLEKRVALDRLNLIKYTNAMLLTKLIPVLDDLERAQSHLNDPGLTQILLQFTKLLDTEGVKVIDPAGSLFDPSSMDCAEVVEGEKDKVVATQLKGYLYQDRVLRPARVTVGNGSVNVKSKL